MRQSSELPSEVVYGHPLIFHTPLRSPEDVRLFHDHVQRIAEGKNVLAHHPLRVSIMQVNLAETEWNDTLLQHAVLFNQDFAPVHINLSTEALYGRSITESISNYLLKMCSKLVLQFNHEAWATYCDWIGEEIVMTLARFQPEDSEEYQLQARLEDFLHEIRSTLLRDQRQMLQQVIRGEYAILQKNDNESLKQIEKEIILCRDNILNLLSAQRELLLSVHRGIEKIETLHPELIPLKMTALLMERLMTQELGWSKTVLICQLLDQQLQVVSAVTGSADDGRAGIVYAIRRAIADLSGHHPIEQVIEMCLQWDEGNRGEAMADELRHFVAENFHQWLKRNPMDKSLLQPEINGEWIAFLSGNKTT